MKKWKIIKSISIGVLILFIAMVVINAISCYMYDRTYPYPALGIDIHNSYEQFYLNMTFILYIWCVPLIIDIVFFIISIIKIRKLENN